MLEPQASYAGITEYALDNGLRLLLIPDPSQATVTVNLTVFAGSACEDYGETGAAHLLEHLVFKGTPDFPDPPRALNEHGASFNGTTWTDRTNYYETLPASDESLEFGIHFEAERLHRCFIRKEDLDSEMTVVRNEFESGENSPIMVLYQRLLSTAFLYHGYGHPTIGARSDIEEVPIERLQGFYRRWYRPDNAMLVLAGRFDEVRAKELVERHFGAIPRPTEGLTPTYTVEPPQDGERQVSLRRVGEVGMAAVAYHTPAAAHPDSAALEVLAEILAATPSGRLHRGLVETGKAVSVYPMVFLLRDPSLAMFFAEVRRDGSLEAVRDEMLELIQQLGDEAPSKEEVARARNSLLVDRTHVFSNAERLAKEMSEWAAMGDWRLFFSHRQALEKVAAEDVHRVAAAYLRTANRTVGMYLPSDAAERTEVPQVEDPAAIVGGLVAASEAAEPEALAIDPDTLEGRIRRETVGEVGLELALLSKRTRGSIVTGQLRLHVGQAASLLEDPERNDLLVSMLDRGSRRRDRTALKDEMDRLCAEVSVGGGVNDACVRFATTRDNVAELLGLLAEMLREPALDERELELLRSESLAELEEASHEPNSLASVALGHHLYPREHLRHSFTIEEQIEWLRAVDRERLVAFHEAHYGAEDAQLAVLGDFDPEQVTRVAAELFGDWRSRDGAARVDLACPAAAPVVVREIECPDKENAMTVAGRTFAMSRLDRRYPAALLANYVLGGLPLDSRLAQRLRAKEGLCYGVWSQIQVDIRSDLGVVSFGAISAPQNAERVEQGFREELERAARDGIDGDEVERARRGYLDQVEVRLARDAILAAELSDSMLRSEVLDGLRRLQQGLREVTAEEVSALAAELFDADRMPLFRAGDFARVRSAAAS